MPSPTSAAPARRSIRRSRWRRWTARRTSVPSVHHAQWSGARSALRQATQTATPDGGVHDLFVITGRSDAPRLQHRPAGLRQRDRRQQHHLPHSDAGVRRRAGRGRSGRRRSQATLAAIREFQKSQFGISGRLQPQRQRRHDHPLRLEGAEQVAADLRRRGLQRRAGRDQRDLPQRARDRPRTASSTARPRIARRSIAVDRRRDGRSADITSFAAFARLSDAPKLGADQLDLLAGQPGVQRTSAARSATRSRQTTGNVRLHRAEQQDVPSVQRLRAARHGTGTGRRHLAGRRRRQRVPQRAAVGRRAAHLLPA